MDKIGKLLLGIISKGGSIPVLLPNLLFPVLVASSVVLPSVIATDLEDVAADRTLKADLAPQLSDAWVQSTQLI